MRAGHVRHTGFAGRCSSQPCAAFQSRRRPRHGRRPCRLRAEASSPHAALSALRTLLAASPSDSAMAFDLAVVLEWAGRPREATDVFERTGVAEPPEYILGAMVRAYRTEKRWAEAGALAAQGARRFPADLHWPLALWMVRGDEAVASGDQFAALGAYLHAAELAPDDAGIAREVSGILVRLGAPFAAGMQSRTRDLGIEAAQAAALVTAAEVGDPINALLIQARQTRRSPFKHGSHRCPPRRRRGRDASGCRPPAAPAPRPCDCPARSRAWAATAEAVAALRKDGNAIPPYVRHAEADALLALRRPEEAAAAYEEVLAGNPSLAPRARGPVLRVARAGRHRPGTYTRGCDGCGRRPQARYVGQLASGSTRSCWRQSRATMPASQPGGGSSRWSEGAPGTRVPSLARRPDQPALKAGRGSPTRSRTSPPRSRRRTVRRRSRSRKRRSLASASTKPRAAARRSSRSTPRNQGVERLRRKVRAHECRRAARGVRDTVRARQRR